MIALPEFTAQFDAFAAQQLWNEQSGIYETIEHALSLTDTLAVMLRQGKGSIRDFEATAGRLLRLYPGAVAPQLAPRGALALTLPSAVNAERMGHDLLRDLDSANESPAAGDGRRLTLSGPLTLREGRQVAAGRLPISLDDGQGREAFWGFAVSFWRFRKCWPRRAWRNCRNVDTPGSCRASIRRHARSR